MPFWEQEVKIPAVNYRGAKKIGGAKTRSGSVERGTDIAKIKPKIGNTASRLGRSRLESCYPAFVVLYSYDQSTSQSQCLCGIVARYTAICR